MTSFRHSDTEIGIYKEWKRKLGWLATASFEESKYGIKAKIEIFIPTQPLTEEDKEQNFRKKVNKQIGKIPDNYNGLIVSNSPYEGTRCERWYWLCKDGRIVANSEEVEEMYKKSAK